MLVQEETPKTEIKRAPGGESEAILNKKVFDTLGFSCKQKKKVTKKGAHFLWQIHVKGVHRGTFLVEVPASQDHCYTADSLEHLIREGFPFIAGEAVKKTLSLTDDQLAEMMGISMRTLHRKRKESQSLSMVESDRLYRLARIYATATRTLQNDEMAKIWLNRPQRGLGERIPMKVIETEAGAKEVEDLLGRIEYGVIS